MISKRANMNKARHPELVLYVLGSLLGSCSTSSNARRRRTISASLKKKNMSVGVKKKGMKENKPSYIGAILSSDTVEMKV